MAVAVAFALAAALAALLAMRVGPAPSPADAASHREAPLIANDPTADITDFFMFRSYEPGNADKVELVMNVIPMEEPSAGPNYYNFDPSVAYRFQVDNNADGIANDVTFELKFENEFRGTVAAARLPLSYVAVPGPITALDGPGSEGLGFRQRYSITMTKSGRAPQLIASGKIAVPSNVGPRTMPNYEALVAQGIYDLGNGIRVFAGQRQDPFYIDLGAVFDTLNLRAPGPLLSTTYDADDSATAGVDMLSGFNVHTIALEVPASLLTRDGRSAEQTASPKIGAYASTSRPRLAVRGVFGRAQVQRLANPLVNEVIIGTVDKDGWNASSPQEESRFLDYYLNPRLALALELVFGAPAAKTGRQDLVDALLKYRPGDTTLSELLRLDLSVPPTPLAQQKRLGPLAHDAAGTPTPDPAGWPNGRRPKDDVTDVAVRLVGGPNYIAARAGDGVNSDDAPLPNAFPFLATPEDGFTRFHENP